jgi:hypothetical protein
MLNMTPPFSLRPFGQHDREADFRRILALAHAQVPQDPRGNEEWLQYRRAYDEHLGQRRHYIAIHVPTQEPIGYAALEQQQADPSSFRIYLVFDPRRWSFEELGAFMYRQLLRDAEALGAARLVCAEYADDTTFRAFLERQNFRHAGDGTYNGFNIVRYEKVIRDQAQA